MVHLNNYKLSELGKRYLRGCLIRDPGGRDTVADTSRNIRGGGGRRNFQHVCLRFKICESFKYNA